MMKWFLIGLIMSLSGGATLQAGGISSGLRELLDNSSAYGSDALGATFRDNSVFIQTVPGKDDLICIPVPKPKPKPQTPEPDSE